MDEQAAARRTTLTTRSARRSRRGPGARWGRPTRSLAPTLAVLVAATLTTGAAAPGDPVGARSSWTPEAAAPAAGARATAVTVRVATANISARLSDAAFRADLARTYASQADLVALNETGARSPEQLQVSGYRVFRDEKATGQARSTAVAWRGARWSLLGAGRKRLVRRGPQRWDAGRSATWATLRGTGGRRDAGVVSLVSVHHMINPARYGPRRPRRQVLYRRGVRRIARLVTELSARGPVVVAGDFNSQWWADDRWGPRHQLGERRLGADLAMQDSMSVLGRTPTHDGGGTIDYVFSQPARVTPTAQRSTALRSDHRLLTVDLRVR